MTEKMQTKDIMVVEGGAAMSNLPARAEEMDRDDMALMEQVVVGGDLARLKPAERLAYYARVCRSLNLNPYSRPLEYIVLSGKLTLYARKDATDQLRKLHRISIQIVEQQQQGEIYTVTARATTPDGRTDEDQGVVWLVNPKTMKPLTGDELCNARLKAITKSKRRVTLSICGLGWLDESEIETIPTARVIADAEALPAMASGEELEKRVRKEAAINKLIAELRDEWGFPARAPEPDATIRELNEHGTLLSRELTHLKEEYGTPEHYRAAMQVGAGESGAESSEEPRLDAEWDAAMEEGA